MAKLTGPLMSMGATGSIGKAITFSKWKGINTARQRVSPSNPNTAGQQAQRGIMATVVAFWRSSLTGLLGKEAWNLAASVASKAQSGFNAFTSAACKIAAQDPDASMVTEFTGLFDDGEFAAVLKNLDDGTTGDETGNFTIVYGTSASQMLNSTTASITAGEISATISGYSAGDTVYVRVQKDAGTIVGANRSGIAKMTVEAA